MLALQKDLKKPGVVHIINPLILQNILGMNRHAKLWIQGSSVGISTLTVQCVYAHGCLCS